MHCSRTHSPSACPHRPYSHDLTRFCKKGPTDSFLCCPVRPVLRVSTPPLLLCTLLRHTKNMSYQRCSRFLIWAHKEGHIGRCWCCSVPVCLASVHIHTSTAPSTSIMRVKIAIPAVPSVFPVQLAVKLMQSVAKVKHLPRHAPLYTSLLNQTVSTIIQSPQQSPG